MKIIVLGSGISGLSCAIKLQEAGFESVSILARNFPPNTTSDVAGGLWFPYKAEPIHRILGWSKATFQELMRLREQFPEAGITMTEFFQYFRKRVETDAWWASAVEQYRKLSDDEIPVGFKGGYTAEVPIAEPHIHLPFLMRRFEERGGVLQEGNVSSLMEIASPEHIIINCTGLDAKQLLGDNEVFPIRGQIMRVRNPGIRRSLTIEADNEHSEYATYTIARSEDVILGGVAMVNNWDSAIDEGLVQGILDRCREVEPALYNAEILGHKAGLRPGRTEVRLELEELRLQGSSDTAAVVHNYGHGGSGYTVNWGCADEVVALVQRYTVKKT
jgi:D-amino-acid oxidase